MVGLHGVGGLGKTTLCKVMVNHFSSPFHGKSCLIEFPSPGGGDLLRIVSKRCKRALKKFTDTSYEHLLNEADSFDQVVQLMKERVRCHDVFLAIDNVWDSSANVARRLLSVDFSAKSKILVTSRSEGVLKELLNINGEGPINNVSVAPLPAPDRKEAFQIFQETFKSYDLSKFLDSTQMDVLLGKCMFSGKYLALALETLAKYVKRVCMAVEPEGIKPLLLCVLEEISHEDLSDVEDVIRLSYDYLQEQKKHMFLDLVVCLKEKCWSLTRADAQEWFSFLYWKFPKSKTIRLMNELSLDGLIQLEVNKFGTKKIGLHDLYRELALKEIACSPRFLIEDITKSVEEIEWEKLEIVILNGDKPGPWLFEKLQQCNCPKLKWLSAVYIQIKSGIRLNSYMRSLSVLKLDCITLVKSSEEENVAQSHLLQHLEQVSGMPSLDQEEDAVNNSTSFVRGAGPVDASRILHLNGLVELRKLDVRMCGFVEGIAGLDTLRNLQMFRVYYCKRLKGVDGLSSLTCLERLELFENRAMKEVGDLSLTLKDVRVERCRELKRMPDMSSLTCLERLELLENRAMEEVGGLSCTLKDVRIERCRALKSMPDMSSLTCLERLALHWNEALEEIGDLSVLCRLEDLRIGYCSSLKMLNAGCPSLKKLEVCYCEVLEEIVGDNLMALKSLRIEGCQGLKKVAGLLIDQGKDVIGCESLQRKRLGRDRGL